MHILIAPNAFKNSLTADRAAMAITKGLERSKLPCTLKCFPIGDGGDGTGSLLMQYLGAKKIKKQVHDPFGKKINSFLGITANSETAIIELANASGLRLLKKNKYDPLQATTSGTGDLIDHALKKGVKKIILCIGGSATVDGGMGIIRTLGGKFLDSKGRELKKGPVSLSDLAHIDLSGLNKKIWDTELIVLCDVENSLLGKKGSAAVFGPQKGASKTEVKKLEACLKRLRHVVYKMNGKDMAATRYGGAAGGVAAGLYAMLNAKLVNGIEYFLDITGFDDELNKADLLITGEGSIDIQTLHGKAPFGVAKRAKEKRIPVIAFAGKTPLKPDARLEKYFDIIMPINDEITDLETALAKAYNNLSRSAKYVGILLDAKKETYTILSPKMISSPSLI